MEKKEEGDHVRQKKVRAAATANGHVWNCGSSLYDAYELISVAYLIEKKTTMAMRAAPSSQFQTIAMKMNTTNEEKEKLKPIKSSRLISSLCCFIKK
ncbi:hypothetical protein C2S52_008347 [Perilla frutescens var. hirtella]|uniref:Uncharacterized protein n=1 Tax=Perilla frutescens var. hirtella TaxID=608512 RepID=A0AAD4J162_PERFH|nr:hypothetical protein C2S51_017924 [Perilla frutescens var. frutescens]KAH6783388.1 hypothetical protein C2S52_008347 [Perilla frutescens var. hirtella]KAH6825019.1 hypothetical protein C2S53_000671 [Perilla frutescens var. hirtella]